MNEDWWSGRTLQRTTPRATQFYRATRAGESVTVEAWTAGKPPRTTTRAHADAHAAKREMFRAVRKKMLEAYVLLDPSAAPGSPVFACALPGGGPADNFDLSPDNTTLFIGAGRGDPTGRVLRADLTTGAVHSFAITPDVRGNRQLFVHGAVVHPSGLSGLFGLNSAVRSVDLTTGAQTDIAAALGPDGVQTINPHCVELERDARHTRVLLVDSAHLEVRDLETGATLQTIPLAEEHGECRKTAMSPSGAFALAYHCDPDVAYDHDFASGPVRHRILVYRAHDGAEAHRIPLRTRAVRTMSLSPDDTTLVLVTDYTESLTCIDLATQKVHTFTPDPDAGSGKSSISWTPSGLLTLHHRDRCDCYDIHTGALVKTLSHAPFELIEQRHRLSPDGTRLIVGGDGTFIVFAVDPLTT